MKRITFLLLFACSIFTGGVTGKQKQDVHFPIKIGLLADTQLTSHNGFSNYNVRSKSADRIGARRVPGGTVTYFFELARGKKPVKKTKVGLCLLDRKI